MPMKDQIESSSYMELKMHQDGGSTYVLKIPTFWDAVNNKWIAAIKTPKTKMIIHAEGLDSMSLQNDFNVKFHDCLTNPEIQDEVFSMFTEVK